MNPLVIIGTGLAGYTLAREFRKLDKETPLTIVTADDGRFYSKPMLSNALASGKSPDELATANAAQMAKQLDAEIKTQCKITAISIEKKAVLANGFAQRYSKLVLSVGAHQLKPTLAGDAADSILTVNDLADYTRFRNAILNAERVVIIGAGLIGCEFANDLSRAGMNVEVIVWGREPLDHLMPETIGRKLRFALSEANVSWHRNSVAERVDRENGHYVVTLADGTHVTGDVVLSATGLGPNTTLAQSAGIQVKRGIVVDRFLETSVKDTFALGDCAELDGQVLPFVMPLMNQARTLARTLSGTPTQLTYPVMPIVVKTPAHPITIAPAPPGTPGEWKVEELPNGVRALFYDADQNLRGFALSGDAVAEKQALAKKLSGL